MTRVRWIGVGLIAVGLALVAPAAFFVAHAIWADPALAEALRDIAISFGAVGGCMLVVIGLAAYSGGGR